MLASSLPVISHILNGARALKSGSLGKLAKVSHPMSPSVKKGLGTLAVA